MSIDRRLLLLASALPAWASAQTSTFARLSSPLGTPSAAVGAPTQAASGLRGASGSAAASAPPAAAGQSLSDFANKSGGGYHSPLSAFQPLPDRGDVVPWTTLIGIQTRFENKRLVPVFTPAVTALSGKSQRVQGFMMPLQPGERITHFLLSQVPLTCGFCVPGGPESMIEVRAKTPVKYGFDAIVVEGRFAALQNDPYGLYYRVTDAVAVR